MPESDWEERYQSGNMPWEKGEPAPGLVDFLQGHPELPPGRVCVPGCGTGHDVRVWARHGFEATGLDIAPSAVRLAQEKTAAAGLRAEIRLGNFLEESPAKPFDWVFEHTLFCAINPNRREQYVEAVCRWLLPHGQFLAIYYLICDQDGPPFGTTKEEVRSLFEPAFELISDWVPRSYPNRTGLEWMVWWKRRERPS